MHRVRVPGRAGRQHRQEEHLKPPSTAQWTLRTRKPADRKDIKERQPDQHLQDLIIGDRVIVPGPQRCGAVWLPLGDCRQRRNPDSAYCYYHHKLAEEMTTPTADTYPVWPLPKHGYFVNKENK